MVRSESPSKPHALACSTPASLSVSSSSGSPMIRDTRSSRAARAKGASGLAQTAVTVIPSSHSSWRTRTPRPSSPTSTTRPPEPETLGPLFMTHSRRQSLWRSPLGAAVAARGKVFVPYVQRGLHLIFRTTSSPWTHRHHTITAPARTSRLPSASETVAPKTSVMTEDGVATLGRARCNRGNTVGRSPVSFWRQKSYDRDPCRCAGVEVCGKG